MSSNIIPYGKQHICDDDIQAIIETLQSDYLTQGPKIKEFEEAFADYVGAKYAVAVSNGTAALHLNCLALDLKTGDKVITTPITFAASANCIRYCGGEVVFADIDPETYLLDIEKVRLLLERDIDRKIKGIIPVDFSGRAVNLEKFKDLANQYNLWIIEDSCHSPGGWFRDSKGKIQNCGNGNYADLAIFSFHPVKHIATGEGGMITTNNEDLYSKLLTLRTHGITRISNNFTNSIELSGGDMDYPGWYMEMQTLGFNYRLTDFQAALGISQLSRAEYGLEKRKFLAKRYFDAFDGNSKILGQSGYIDGHAYHLYVIEIENRLELYNNLKERNIFTQVHYIPTHLMPYYRQFGWKETDFPHAEAYYKKCLSLPMYPTLTAEDQNRVIDSVLEFLL